VEKNSVLFAHVPESSVIVIVRWKDGVGKNGVLFAHVPEPLVFGMRKGRGGKEWCSFCTRAGAISFWYEKRTRWERTVFFSHTCRGQSFWV
jgi:hypothetical protein